jgi:hypothetical protein
MNLINDNLISELFRSDDLTVYDFEKFFPGEVEKIRRAASLQEADGIVCRLIDTLSNGPATGMSENQRAWFHSFLLGAREMQWSVTEHGDVRRGTQFK